MFKPTLSSLTSKVTMTLAGVLFISSTIGAVAAPQLPPEPPEPECYGDWRVTGTDRYGNPIDVTRFGYIFGCKAHWESHTVIGCYLTRGNDGRVARWFDDNYDRCPDRVQISNPSPYPDEVFQVITSQ